MQLALNNRTETIFEFGLPSIIAFKEHHTSSFSSLLSSVSSKFTYFVIFSQKHDSQYATELPDFQSATLSSFSNMHGTTHTEVVYAHQASTFLALEARGTHIFALFLPFCLKRSKHGPYVRVRYMKSSTLESELLLSRTD